MYASGMDKAGHCGVRLRKENILCVCRPVTAHAMFRAPVGANISFFLAHCGWRMADNLVNRWRMSSNVEPCKPILQSALTHILLMAVSTQQFTNP